MWISPHVVRWVEEWREHPPEVVERVPVEYADDYAQPIHQRIEWGYLHTTVDSLFIEEVKRTYYVNVHSKDAEGRPINVGITARQIVDADADENPETTVTVVNAFIDRVWKGEYVVEAPSLVDVDGDGLPNYKFDGWSTDGGVDVLDAGDPSTTLIVDGVGGLTAHYDPIPSIPTLTTLNIAGKN
jgi:hypothetical protein